MAPPQKWTESEDKEPGAATALATLAILYNQDHSQWASPTLSITAIDDFTLKKK